MTRTHSRRRLAVSHRIFECSIQADETPIGVQTPDKRGQTHRAYFWQFSAPGKGVIFNFEMTRSKKVAQKFFKDYGGILPTDGYVAYEKDIGAKDMIHACCWSHSRRGFIDALKVQQKANSANRELERVVVLMDSLFAIDREAREQIYRWMRVMHCVRSEPPTSLQNYMRCLRR